MYGYSIQSVPQPLTQCYRDRLWIQNNPDPDNADTEYNDEDYLSTIIYHQSLLVMYCCYKPK